jgi:hypothetical protein
MHGQIACKSFRGGRGQRRPKSGDAPGLVKHGGERRSDHRLEDVLLRLILVFV